MPSGESVTKKIVKAIFSLRADRKTCKDICLVFEEREDWVRWIVKRYSKDTGLPSRAASRSGIGEIWMQFGLVDWLVSDELRVSSNRKSKPR